MDNLWAFLNLLNYKKNKSLIKTSFILSIEKLPITENPRFTGYLGEINCTVLMKYHEANRIIIYIMLYVKLGRLII